MKITLALILAASAVCARDLWVSPHGTAQGDGSRRRPFATLEQARDTIRAARRRGDAEPPEGWCVRLTRGTHTLSAPFVLEPVDAGGAAAPLVFIGQGERTRVSGGIEVKGWRETPGGVWEAPIPRLPDGSRAYFESLYVNDARAVRARHPNTGFLTPQRVAETLATNASSKIEYAVAELVGREGDLALLADVPVEELRYAHLVVHHNWDTTRRMILSFDERTDSVRTQGGKWKPWNPWRANSLYYIENLRCAFDEPGEWLYDGARDRVLYRPRPGECLPNGSRGARIVAPLPGLTTLLALRGEVGATNFVSDVHFKNISFCYTDSPRRADQVGRFSIDPALLGPADKPGPTQFEPTQAAAHTEAVIMADGAHRIVFEDCEVAHTGEYGIWFRSGCMSNRIVRCVLTDLGAGGIRIGDSSGRGLSIASNAVAVAQGPFWTAFNEVDNCIITSGGRFHASGVAVWIGHSPDNRITHNEIRDHFYTGVSVGWVWGYRGSVAQRNLIAFNHIHKIGQGALGDMGGVYTLGTSFGTRVCNNVIHDVDSYTYGGWGLYPDEGTEGIVMENNLVYNTKDSSFHQHYGRDNLVRNNILAYSRQFQVAITRAEPHRSATFENNIILWELPGEGLASKRYRGTEKAITEWRGNLWWCDNGAVDFGGRTFEQWRTAGNDLDGLVMDPLFVDAPRRDFRLRAASPAFKLGFKPFDIAKAGVYGSRAWRRRAQERD